MANVVVIEPINKKKPGRVSIAGYDGNPRNHFVLSKTVYVDLDTPEGKKYLDDIKTNRQLRGKILVPGDVQTPAHVFRIIDREAEAKDSLNAFAKTNELMNEVFAMNDTELSMFGNLFNFIGSPNSIKQNLLQKISHSKEGAKEVERKLKSEDRTYVEVIFYHVEKNKGKDEGLHKVDGNIYKFNGSTIGEGYEKVIAWLKEPKNEVLFGDLKKEAKRTIEGESAPKNQRVGKGK